MGNKKSIKSKIKSKIKKRLLKFLKVVEPEKKPSFDKDFSSFEIDVINKTSAYTMTSPERIVSLIRATEYIESNNIKGAIVECGIWKGGSIMAVLETLKKNNNVRDVYLYDTFEGMTEPSNLDYSYSGTSAKKIHQNKEGDWCYSSLDEVKENLKPINYPTENLIFVEGKVEDTIPKTVPDEIALLRLDTDWYESTKHEMNHLFPRLVKGGIIIIDDYGHWSGCKKAIDEYFDKNNIALFLSRVDYTCRIGVKI